jgi:uncharacterized protein (TIGR00730 family)
VFVGVHPSFVERALPARKRLHAHRAHAQVPSVGAAQRYTNKDHFENLPARDQHNNMNLNTSTRLEQRVHDELEVAQQLLGHITQAVSIYGGSRVLPGDPYYAATVELAKALSDAGVCVISGGGPGIMEAANKGCQLGRNGTSIGLNIVLPFEQAPNAFQDISVNFFHFAPRKIAFCRYSSAFVCMPGGLGTLDELFEVTTLIQTGKMPEVPVLLYGSEFWGGLVEWMRATMLARGLISEQDLNSRMLLVDSAQDVLKVVQAHASQPLQPCAA